MLPVTLSFPGKLCMFSYDEKILILQKNVKHEWDFAKQEMICTGTIPDKEWEIQGEPYAMNNEIYFISQSEIYRYDLIQGQISLVKNLIS